MSQVHSTSSLMIAALMFDAGALADDPAERKVLSAEEMIEIRQRIAGLSVPLSRRWRSR